MQILSTLPEGEIRETLIPQELRRQIEELGDVTWNPNSRQFTSTELRERLNKTDILISGWGCPILDEDVLSKADDLQLVTHIGGSVARLTTQELYDSGVIVCSAIEEMGRFVAEGILAYMLSSLRDIPAFDSELKSGGWHRKQERLETLFEKQVGFVGLGTVGRALLDLLDPFGVEVSIYDPYVSSEELADHNNARMSDLESVLSTSEIVSIHAAKTKETLHMIDAERLNLLPDGCLLVNTARGAIINEEDLITELQTGRIFAALDVFEQQPLPADSELRSLNNVVIGPHKAGAPTRERMTEAMIAEIERFIADEPLQHKISRRRAELMTDARLSADDI